MKKIYPLKGWVNNRSPFVEVEMPPMVTLWSDICQAYIEAVRRNEFLNALMLVDLGLDEPSVMTLGWWLQRNLRIRFVSTTKFVVHYPRESPPEIKELLAQINSAEIISNCQYWGDNRYRGKWVTSVNSL